jgi:hypothetical protein
MASDLVGLFPKAQKRKTKADIVFCLDVTGSMQPCIDALKANLMNFVNALQTTATVDAHLRLIAFRDKHDTSIVNGRKVSEEPWLITEFTDNPSQFAQWLNDPVVQAFGGGDDPESALDALYLAIAKSKWREHEIHRSILVFTDDDSHPELHESTYSYPDRGVARVIQEFQTMPHAMLFMVVPRFRVYEQLEQAMKVADRKIIANYVPYHHGDPKHSYYGLAGVNWSKFLEMLGQTVSSTSLCVGDRV